MTANRRHILHGTSVLALAGVSGIRHGDANISPIDAVLAVTFPSGEKGAFAEVYDVESRFQDVDEITPALLDNEPIALLKDKSPNGNDFAQAVDANRMLVVSNSHNGLDGMDGGAANQNLVTPNNIFDNGSDTSFSLYALVKRAVSGSVVVHTSHTTAALYAGEISSLPTINNSGLSDTQMNITRSPDEDVRLVCFRYDGVTKKLADYGTLGQRFAEEAATGNLGFSVGGLVIGSLSNGSFAFDGDILAILAVDKTLTDPEHVIVTNYFRSKAALNYQSAPRVICDGNSLTFGTGSTSPGGATAYPAQMQAALPGWDIVNNGFPANQTSQRQTAAPEQIDIKYGSNRSKKCSCTVGKLQTIFISTLQPMQQQR